MFDTIEQARLSELHVKSDAQSQLRAIIAIHNTKFGPALGGCRCIEYANDDAAMLDAVRLAKGMSYKAAMADIPQGGGKAVLIRPKHIQDREKYFEAFGQFVNELGGRYITAVDSGTSQADMDVVAHTTNFVSGTTNNGGDPSPNTAVGVLEGIKSCVRFRYHKDSLDGVHIAIQGVGNVGGYLAEWLAEAGARLTITDIDQEKLHHYSNKLKAQVVAPEEIYSVPCDIFSPCSLGAIINDQTIRQLNCDIVAGSANNQLADLTHGQQLFDKNILYAPDYVINAGGLIHVSLTNKIPRAETVINEKTSAIGETLMQVFSRADQENQPTSLIADRLAEEKLYH